MEIYWKIKGFVRSGIRTHAHRSGLRPERSALDLSAILTRHIGYARKKKKSYASSGNRTRAARVAGEHSTTEPTMPLLELLQKTMPNQRYVLEVNQISVSWVTMKICL